MHPRGRACPAPPSPTTAFVEEVVEALGWSTSSNEVTGVVRWHLRLLMKAAAKRQRDAAA